MALDPPPTQARRHLADAPSFCSANWRLALDRRHFENHGQFLGMDEVLEQNP